MDPGVIEVTGPCMFLALWYGVGHLYNRRRGQRLFHWLETGLEVLNSRCLTACVVNGTGLQYG